MTSSPNARSAATTIYTASSPALGQWSGISYGNQNLSCGNFVGGLKAAIVAISGNKVTVRVEKGIDGTFASTGTAYIKAGNNFCGNIAGSTPILSNHYYSLIDFWCTFDGNQTVNFIPSVTLTNGVRMYAPTIAIKAVTPIETTTVLPIVYYQGKTGGLPYGTVYGTVNGVEVISNGPNTTTTGARQYYNRIDIGLPYQCVHLIRKYFMQKYNKAMGSNSDAKDFYVNLF